jgi:segregation and condensation protein A
MAAAAGRSFPRTAGLDDAFVALAPELLAGVTPGDVREAYLRATAPKLSPRVILDHVAPIRTSVRDAIDELVDELPRLGRTTFRKLTGDLAERLEVIVRFLAVLELYKQGMVDIDQQSTFGEIEVAWIAGSDEETKERVLAMADAYDG